MSSLMNTMAKGTTLTQEEYVHQQDCGGVPEEHEAECLDSFPEIVKQRVCGSRGAHDCRGECSSGAREYFKEELLHSVLQGLQGRGCLLPG